MLVNDRTTNPIFRAVHVAPGGAAIGADLGRPGDGIRRVGLVGGGHREPARQLGRAGRDGGGAASVGALTLSLWEHGDGSGHEFIPSGHTRRLYYDLNSYLNPSVSSIGSISNVAAIS